MSSIMVCFKITKFVNATGKVNKQEYEDLYRYSREDNDNFWSKQGEKIDWTSWLLGFAPWLLLIAFWLFIIRRMQGSGSGMNNVFSFGKSKNQYPKY